MTYQFSFPVAGPHITGRITVLRCNDQFLVDDAALAKMMADMTPKDAERMVCSALEDIAKALDDLQDLARAGQYADVARPARRIATIACQIGLASITAIAQDVADAAATQNSVALGATMARLERAFDMAVSHIWDFRHTTG